MDNEIGVSRESINNKSYIYVKTNR